MPATRHSLMLGQPRKLISEAYESLRFYSEVTAQSIMTTSKSIPQQIAGYNILLLSLPPLPSFPTAATHYLYLALHQPKVPSPTASRSLFLVNVPFDATEAHIKRLLSGQIDLPAGRIEDVLLEGQRRQHINVTEQDSSNQKPANRGKKRKRGSGGVAALDNAEGSALPSTWDRDLQVNGLTAVVLFVDRASMDAALKAAKSARKERKDLIWGEGMEGKVPALGSASEPLKFSWAPNFLLTFQRILESLPSHISRQN